MIAIIEVSDDEKKAEAEKKETELLNTIKDMDIKYNKSLSKLTAKRDERKSRRGIEFWNNKIEEFKEQYKKQISTFKDAVDEQKTNKMKAEQDLEEYRRYNQSGKEFIDMAKEYGRTKD